MCTQTLNKIFDMVQHKGILKLLVEINYVEKCYIILFRPSTKSHQYRDMVVSGRHINRMVRCATNVQNLRHSR